MKKIILLLAVAVVGMVGFQSCTGPEGIPGRDGNDGYSAESEVFEVSTSFNQANFFATTFGLNPVILDSDNILVYELVNTNDGIDTWALLPQIYYFNEGSAQYNFDFSYDQFTIFIDADFDKNLLPSAFTSGKTFRIVIVPGYFSNKSAVDTKDYNAVIKAYGIDDSNVKTLKQK